MQKSSNLTFAVLGASLVMAALMGCAQAEETKAAAPSSSVYYLSYSGEAGSDETTNWGWSNSYIGIAPLADKTISDAEITYAFDANFVSNLTDAGADWQAYTHGTTAFSWLFEFASTTVPAANTWKKAKFSTDDTASTAISSGIGLKFWDKSNNAAASVYLKSVVLTYSDASTETLTFTDTSGTNVHSVTSTGATTDPTVASRLGITATSNCVSPTQGIKTVAF